MERDFLELAFSIQRIDATERVLSSAGFGIPVRRRAFFPDDVPHPALNPMLDTDSQRPLDQPPFNDRKSHRIRIGNSLPTIDSWYRLHCDSQTWTWPDPIGYGPSPYGSNVFSEDTAPP